MTAKRRLSGEARRASIVMAARRVFAENGFRGTTTKALAEAAGVSEALLFKHFPSKEAIFAAMQASYSREQSSAEFGELIAAEPSTATLVRIVHGFYSRLIEKCHEKDASDDATLARLMFRSLTEDGEFARLFIQGVASNLARKIEECIRAAAAAGDLVGEPLTASLSAWFTHHLAVMLMLQQLPDPSVVDYGVSKATLVAQAVYFALRGTGLTEEAIRRCYRPEEWARARD
jgi:AcrR family transcriptional regulator